MRRFLEKLRESQKIKNIAPKLVCLLLAFVLWAYISGNNVSELQLRLPVVFENLPADMVMSRISIRHVSVVARGTKEQIKDFQAKNIRAVVNMEEPKTDIIFQYPIQIIKKDIPNSLNITSKQETVEVFVEKKISKMITVVPVTTGAVADGFAIGSIKVKPSLVQVLGAKSAIDKIKTVNTEEISIGGAENDIIVDAVLTKTAADSLEFKEDSVQVSISVGESRLFFNLSLPIVIQNQLENYDFNLTNEKYITIYMKGQNTPDIGGNIEVSVDVSSLKFGELLKDQQKAIVTLPVNIAYKKNLPGIEVISFSPEEVSITIREK